MEWYIKWWKGVVLENRGNSVNNNVDCLSTK